LIEGQQPTCRDLSLIDDVVDPDARPTSLAPSDSRRAVCQRSKTAIVANQDISTVHRQRSMGEVTAATEVVEHLLETVITAGDMTVARHDPGDVRGEQLTQNSAVRTAVERILRLMQIVKEGYRACSIHWSRSGIGVPVTR
jgi:hypothetical protein